MKKKSIAALMATVMVITSVFSGTSSVMAADLFSDGSVQSVESADDWNDVPLEEEAFLSETTVTGSAENQSGEQISETTVQNGNESVSNMAENPLQMDTDVETENSENTNPEITIEEIGENEEAIDVEELEKTTVPEEAGNSSDGENFSGQTAQEEWSDGIEENQVLSMPSDTNTNADIVDSGTSGENVTWTLDSEGTLTISGTGTVSNNWRDNVNYRAVKKIIINEGITGIGGSVFRECNQLIQVSLPSGLKTIGAGAFDSCQQLQQINLPLGLTAIEEETFNYCISLGEIDIPSSVTTIGNKAFWDCQNLEKVNFSKGIRSIGDWAFRDCKKLKQINLPYGVTDIGDLAFENCQGLEEAYIPSSVITIGNAAFQSSGLIKAEIPSSVKSLGESIFNTCKSLREVKLPEGITEIPDEMFAACALERIDIPDSVTVIGDGAFNLNFSLKEIEIPEMVTIIGAYAFNQCYALESIIIPANVEVISSDAFSRCSSLNNIVFEGNKPSIGTPFVDVTANGYFPPDNPTWAGITSSWGGGNFRWNVKAIEVSLDNEVYIYTGEQIKPEVTATCEGKVLTEGADYNVSYSNNIEVGTATVTVTGNGDYGSASVDFEIVEANDIRSCRIIKAEDAFVYTGSEIEPKITLIADHGNGEILVYGTDYTITYENNIKPGKALIKVTGCGDYVGEAEISFIILPRTVEQLQSEHHVGWADVYWAPREEADGYEIRYYPSDSLKDVIIQDVPVTENSSELINIKLENLERGKNYIIDVAAYTQGRDGEAVPYYSEENEIEMSVPNLPLIGDCWGFSNPGIVLGTSQYYERYLTKAQAEEYTKLLGIRIEGVCFGMCLSIINSWFSDSPTCAELGVGRLSEVTSLSFNSAVKDAVMYAQAFEAYSNIHGYGYALPEESFNNILIAVEAYLEGHNPVILKLVKRNGSGKAIEGHSVLALDYEIESEEQAKIKIYDPNWPGQERYIYFRGNAENYTSWEYDTGSGIWGNVSGNVSENREDLELGHTYYTLGATMTYGSGEFSVVGSQATSNLNLTAPRIMDGEGSLLIVDAQDENAEPDPGAWLENGSLIELEPSGSDGSAASIIKAYWLKGADSYKFNNVPSNVKLTLASGDYAVTATADENCDITISAGNEIENAVQILAGSSSSVETSFSTYSGTAKKVVTFMGTAQSGTVLKIFQSNSLVKLTGITDLSVSQETLNRDEYEYVPVDTGNELSADGLDPVKEYILGESISGDGSTALMEDSNGDGQGDKVVSVLQRPVDLASCTLALSGTSFTYSGDPQKPGVTVKSNRETLIQGTDYDVSYSNNTNVGTATVTVTGKGRVQGKVSLDFTIKTAPVSDSSIFLSFTGCTYTGSARRPGVTVKRGSTILKNGTDYTVSYSNNINAGTAAVIVAGKGNYSGTAKKSFTINRASLTSCSIALSATRYYYNGNAFKPGVTVKKGSAVLKNGTHYTVAYSGNVNIGTATAIVTGKGNYTGTVRKSYAITTAVGRVYTVGAFKYRITNANINGTGTLALIAPKSRYYTGVTIPATAKIGGVNFKVTTIYLRAFRNCRRLKKVIVGNNVTTICHYAFQGCTNLQYIALGSRVKVIGKYAFYGDKKLKGITIKSRYIRSVGTRAFRGIYSRAVIKMPRAKYTSYKRLFRGKGLSSRVTYRRY